MNNPKISVVTVCYNAAETITATIKSVINQTYKNIEYIVVDGASTDDTVDIIKQYENRITKWISEPDNGIYDAMNKGIKIATGEWINFMNAGDVFYNCEVLQKICGLLNTEYDVVYGDSIHRHSFGQGLVKCSSLQNIEKSLICSHQSCFIKKKEASDKLFDTRYQLAADYKMLLSCYLDGKAFCYVPEVVASVLVDEGATAEGFKKSKMEARNIQISVGLSVIRAWRVYYQELFIYKISKIAKNILPLNLKFWIITHKSS